MIPCYNVERFLDRCMESVVNQSYSDLEIILVDDGSPDSSGQICNRWAEKDSRIKVIHKKNGGLGFARNSGLEIATGDYVAFIDSDDYVDTSMYRKLMDKAMELDADIVYCGHIKQMSDGTNVEVRDFDKQQVFEKDSFVELSQGFFKPTAISPQMLAMSVWHAVYRRSVITQLFYSEREVGSEDIHFQVCAMLGSQRVVFIPDALYTYCYNGESLSHTFDIAKYERYKRLRAVINETYKNVGVLFPADYCVFIMAFVLVRRIALSPLKFREKNEFTRLIVCDDFWKNDHVAKKDLKGLKKLFYVVLKTRSVFLMRLMANSYCLINYTLAKKGQI